MIADLDETIRQILITDLPVKNGEIEISFDQPKREWSARLTKPTANFFLYDIRENPALRTHQWERLPNGNGRDNQAVMKRTPLRVDCHYMLTTWAAEAEDEHRLMTRCLLALFRHPILPVERLVGNLTHQPFEIQARLASHDRLTNPAEVWGALDNEIRPTVSYLVTLALDPWTEVTGPIVRTLVLQSGHRSQQPPYLDLMQETRSEMVWIGGTVRAKGKNGAPAAGVGVAIKDTGLFTSTDEHGRFRLGALPPGQYTLVAWPEKGKPLEKKIGFPSVDGDYDLEI